MSDSDRDEARREEQRREERCADEAYDLRHRSIDIGFPELEDAGRRVEQARRQADHSTRDGTPDIVVCKLEVEQILRQLEARRQSETSWSVPPALRLSTPWWPVSVAAGADVHRKVEQWRQRWDEIRDDVYSGSKFVMDSVEQLQNDVEQYRVRVGTMGSPIFSVPPGVEDLLREFASKLRWLYHHCLVLWSESSF